jgi:hypothetical protein
MKRIGKGHGRSEKGIKVTKVIQKNREFQSNCQWALHYYSIKPIHNGFPKDLEYSSRMVWGNSMEFGAWSKEYLQFQLLMLYCTYFGTVGL